MAPTTHLDPLAAGQQITRGNYGWETTLGQPAGPLTFGFRASAPTYGSGIPGYDTQNTFSRFAPDQIAAEEKVIQEWASAANITFTEVNPGGYTDNAAILF